ncbi:MAG: FmdB family transcriptional regulator [Chloroflexi bacterium]|nr:FmdB family transcriptional regulator [Chloroflexota bacterium]
MPTYVYRCQQCGVTIERRQSFTDERLTVCEACSGELRRVLQPVSVIYKGSGFYTTDYKNAPAPNRPDAKGGSASDGSSSDGSSSEGGSSDGESKGTSEPAAAASTPAPSSSDGKTATATTAPAAPSSTSSST